MNNITYKYKVIPHAQLKVVQHLERCNGAYISEKQRGFRPFPGRGPGKPGECQVSPEIFTFFFCSYTNSFLAFFIISLTGRL